MMFLIYKLIFSFCFSNIITLPSNCNALLPDMYPFINFFNEVGVLWIDTDEKQSKKVFKILTYGNLYNSESEKIENPIFDLIKDNLCQCYKANNNKTFTANSEIIRNYFSKKKLNEIQKIAKDIYIDIKTKNFIRMLSSIRREKNSEKVMKYKRIARNEVINEINKTMNKIKKSK